MVIFQVQCGLALLHPLLGGVEAAVRDGAVVEGEGLWGGDWHGLLLDYGWVRVACSRNISIRWLQGLSKCSLHCSEVCNLALYCLKLYSVAFYRP